MAGLPTLLSNVGITALVLGTLFLGSVSLAVFRLMNAIRQKVKEESALINIPGAPRHWFWGNIKDIQTQADLLPLLKKFMIKYGPIRKVRLGPFFHQIVLSGADHVKTLLSTGEPKEPRIYSLLEPWIGDGLLLSKGKKWARNRKLLTPAFHFDVLKPYCDVFSKCTMIMVNKWKTILESTDRIELFEHVSLMTLDSLLKCAYTYPSNCQLERNKNPYIQAVYDLSDLIIKRIRNPFHQNSFIYYNLSWNGYKFRKACNLIHNYSKAVIQSRRQNPNRDQDKRYLDFLDVLLDARDEAGDGLTDEEIQHEVDTFMFEGHDTTASALSWFFYNMAIHPSEQEKCRREVLSVIEDKDEISNDDLPQFEYLTMCLKESLRTHPPVLGVSRQLTKPMNFPADYSVPAGMCVAASIYATHHNHNLWKDPETFNPERFSPENLKGRPSHAFVPFSAGPRNCIGQNFAMNEMKICAALVLKHMELFYKETDKPIPYPEIILRAKNGIWVIAKRLK